MHQYGQPVVQDELCVADVGNGDVYAGNGRRRGVSWGGLRLRHARDGVAEQRSAGSEQTYHKECQFVSQDAFSRDPNQGWVVRTTLYTSKVPAVTPHIDRLDRQGRLWPTLAWRRAIFGRPNFLMKRYWSCLHYSNKWRTSADKAM